MTAHVAGLHLAQLRITERMAREAAIPNSPASARIGSGPGPKPWKSASGTAVATTSIIRTGRGEKV